MKEVLTMGKNKIYKYQPFCSYAIDNLFSNQIWFSSPSQLNDPLEGKLPYRLEEPDEKEWELIHEKVTTDQYLDIQFHEINKHITPDKSQKHTIEIVAKSILANLIYRKKKVACFSSELNSFLMWSHYADGHRGFCLEFDRTMLPFRRADEIIYTAKYAGFKIDNILSRNILYPDRMMKFKLPRWSYETEVRIVNDDEADVENYLIEALTGIYCGVSMSWECKRLFFMAMRNKMPNTIIYALDNINEENGFSIGIIKQSKPREITYSQDLFMRYTEGKDFISKKK